MISGTTLTAQEAVEQHTHQALIGRQCVAVARQFGNDAVDLVLGEIVDPNDCVIDEPDGALLHVEYQTADDWCLVGIQPDEPIVLLAEVADGAN